MTRFKATFFLLLFTAVAHAISWPASIVREEGYEKTMANTILPFWMRGKEGKFPGKAGLLLPYKAFSVPNERAAIVIVPGHGADKQEYREMVYSFAEERYSVYIYDHRGQGHAPRLAENPQIAHVESFDDYVDDLEIFLSTVVNARPHPRVYVLGSSMGGLVSTLLIQRNPKAFDAQVAAVPAYGLNLKNIPPAIVKVWLRINMSLGNAKAYAPFQKDTSLAEMRDRKELNSYTRWKEELKIRERDPSIFIGGPSNRMLYEFITAGERAMIHAETMSTPTLLIEAEKELTVLSPRISKFYELAPYASRMFLPLAYHRAFLEADFIRAPLMTEIYRYFVHPEKLTEASVDQIDRLISDSKYYLKKNTPAFAQYAIDEGTRVLESKKIQHPDWETAKKAATTALEKSAEGEKALYQWLTQRRNEELKKIYRR